MREDKNTTKSEAPQYFAYIALSVLPYLYILISTFQLVRFHLYVLIHTSLLVHPRPYVMSYTSSPIRPNTYVLICVSSPVRPHLYVLICTFLSMTCKLGRTGGHVQMRAYRIGLGWGRERTDEDAQTRTYRRGRTHEDIQQKTYRWRRSQKDVELRTCRGRSTEEQTQKRRYRKKSSKWKVDYLWTNMNVCLWQFLAIFDV